MFTAKKYAGLLGATQEWQEGENDNAFRIKSSPHGITCEGHSEFWTSLDQLDRFAQAMSEAWAHYDRVRKKITNVRGHCG